MTDATRQHMEAKIALAESGDEAAIRFLRIITEEIAMSVGKDAPVHSLVALAKFLTRSGFDNNAG